MLIAKGKQHLHLLPSMVTRHGLIAGSTGTGKTVTLQVIAENLSKAGVPIFMADVKGDLGGIAHPGSNPKMTERAKKLGVENFSFSGNSVSTWDIYSSNGSSIKTTIKSLGVTLISRMLDLTSAQESTLYQIFKIAEDNKIILRNVRDVYSIINYIIEHVDEYESAYGRISKVSCGTLQRALLAFEDGGQDVLFDTYGNVFDIRNFMALDAQGHGIINLLDATRLIHSPRVYALFLLWMLNELFMVLPEAGDLDKPKMAFFFDEAHLLFRDAPKVLVEQVEKLVKLIRSKGVGVFFITQNPADIPDTILSQLGNRVQHAMRCFTPKEQKALKTISQTFRTSSASTVETAITQLGIGEALISFLDKEGIPNYVQRAKVCPPASQIGVN